MRLTWPPDHITPCAGLNDCCTGPVSSWLLSASCRYTWLIPTITINTTALHTKDPSLTPYIGPIYFYPKMFQHKIYFQDPHQCTSRQFWQCADFINGRGHKNIYKCKLVGLGTWGYAFGTWSQIGFPDSICLTLGDLIWQVKWLWQN